MEILSFFVKDSLRRMERRETKSEWMEKRGGKKWETILVDNSFTTFSCEREQKATWQKLRKGKRLRVKKEIKRSNGKKMQIQRLRWRCRAKDIEIKKEIQTEIKIEKEIDLET